MQSFTHAANALGISKTVVSRAITGLETRLGVRLFQRTTRHLALTESGGSSTPAAPAWLPNWTSSKPAPASAHGSLRGYCGSSPTPPRR
nr:LysR family transcriptional regulator [Paraburkholderia fynbosensis]